MRGYGHFLTVPVRVLPLSSPLLSGHQALDTLSSTLQCISLITWWRKNTVRDKDNWLWTSNAVMLLPSCDCFKIKWCFSAKDYVPPLSSLLPVPWGRPLNGGSTKSINYLSTFIIIIITASTVLLHCKQSDEKNSELASKEQQYSPLSQDLKLVI